MTEGVPELAPAAHRPLRRHPADHLEQSQQGGRDGHRRQAEEQEEQVQLQQRGGLLGDDAEKETGAGGLRGLLPDAGVLMKRHERASFRDNFA